MITIANQNTQNYTGKRGNKFLKYEIISDDTVESGREKDLVLIAYLDNPVFYRQQQKAGVPTIHLYQQTERALTERFGEQSVNYVHSDAARKLLSESFVFEYAMKAERKE